MENNNNYCDAREQQLKKIFEDSIKQLNDKDTTSDHWIKILQETIDCFNFNEERIGKSLAAELKDSLFAAFCDYCQRQNFQEILPKIDDPFFRSDYFKSLQGKPLIDLLQEATRLNSLKPAHQEKLLSCKTVTPTIEIFGQKKTYGEHTGKMQRLGGPK